MVLIFHYGIALGIRHVVQSWPALGRQWWCRGSIGLLLTVRMRTALDCFNSNKGEEGQQQGHKGVGQGGCGWVVAALPHGNATLSG